MAGTTDNQIRRLAKAMQGLADTVNSENPHINIAQLSAACRLFVTKEFGFGQAFEAVDTEISKKVNDVCNGEITNDTIQSVIERDLARGPTVDNVSRAVIRLMRMIELFQIMIVEVLKNKGIESLAEPISIAYGKVWGPFHGPTGFNFVKLLLLPHAPTLSDVLNALNEDENSVRQPFRDYVEASSVVVQHIKSVYESNEESAEFLRLI